MKKQNIDEVLNLEHKNTVKNIKHNLELLKMDFCKWNCDKFTFHQATIKQLLKNIGADPKSLKHKDLNELNLIEKVIDVLLWEKEENYL